MRSATSGAGAAVATVAEFGPFDPLALWAHRAYLVGRPEEAVETARAAALVVGPAGDHLTLHHLRYIEGLALRELGRHHDVVTVALDLVDGLDPVREPWWRAKGLALLAEASEHVGEVRRAMGSLAEAQWLAERSPLGSYTSMSALMAVALALEAMLLFEHADELLGRIDAGTSDARGEGLLHHQRAGLRLVWALTLDAVGHGEDAGPHLVRCAERALRAGRAAVRAGDADLAASAATVEAWALGRLGEVELAAARVRGAGVLPHRRPEWFETQVAHLVLGADSERRGLVDEALDHWQQTCEGTLRGGSEVLGGSAMILMAEAHDRRLGRHPATGLWRSLARTGLQRTWREREGRFDALRDRMRLRELASEADRRERLALEDPLTGLGNRRLLADRLGAATGAPSVVFVDVDRFKAVNDRHTHAVGDEVLRRIARLLLAETRAEDVVVRFGGDEFVVLVTAGEDAAAGVAVRVQEAVRAADWGSLSAGLAVTVSVGVAHAATPEAGVAAADAAMLAAKRRGRDRVVTAS